MGGVYELRRDRGSAGAFHARPVPEPVPRVVWQLDVDRPALVLGSTQPADTVDEVAVAAAGLDLVRRRSGGGAVLLRPGEVAWFDVVMPIDDVRVVAGDDLAASMVWLGDQIARALADLGVTGTTVHRGPMMRTDWSTRVCFAGLGPGELIDAAGAKLVGISQRRTRDSARFQCAAHVEWWWAPLRALFAPPLPTGEIGPVATLDRAVAGRLAGAVAARLGR